MEPLAFSKQMSERYDVRVRIGGRLKRMNIATLVEAISAESLGTEWDAGYLLTCLRTALETASAENRPVEFMTHESNGELTSLTRLLQNLNLPHLVELSGNDQYAPTATVWWPDGTTGWFFTSNNKPVILLEDIGRMSNMVEVEKLIRETQNLAQPIPGLQLFD